MDKEVIPMGPAASQIAIKQLGTNGGVFFGVNSAHPFENPTPLSNLVEMISILLIPASLCITFGRNVKDSKQGRAIFIAMMIVLVAAFAVVAVREQIGTPQLANNHQVDLASINQPGGNMEGKESRFGIASSVTWSVFTTAASNGSVNSMLDFAILTVFIAGLMDFLKFYIRLHRLVEIMALHLLDFMQIQ